MKYKTFVNYFLLSATFFIIGVNATMAGFFSSTLSSDWQARFVDVKLFNDYTKDHQVKLADVEIAKYNIDGANIPRGSFENTHWKEIQAQNSHWGKITFRDSKLELVDFSNATIDDMVFENTTLINVKFSKAQLKNVKFIDSELTETSFWSITNSALSFEKSKITGSNFRAAQAQITFTNTSITDSKFTAMKSPSSLSFADSQLEEVTFSHATLEKLSIVDSKVHETAIKKAKVDKIEFINTTLHISLTGSKIDELLVAGSDLQLLTINHAELPKVRIQRCKNVESMGFYESKIGTLSIDNCPLNNFRLRSAQIENLILENSSLENSKFEEMKAENVTFRKVELKGTLNFTGATIKNLKTEGLTKAPGLRLITAGGNVKF